MMAAKFGIRPPQLASSSSLTLDVNKIVKGLLLGGETLSVNKEELHRLKITHIVNCSKDLQNHFEESLPGFKYYRVDVDDLDDQPINQYFEGSLKFMKDAIDKGHTVFVHCSKGVSRSSTIVLAYLISYHKYSLKDALNFIKTKRPMVQPNCGFVSKLIDFEKTVNKDNKSSMTIEDYRASYQGSIVDAEWLPRKL